MRGHGQHPRVRVPAVGASWPHGPGPLPGTRQHAEPGSTGDLDQHPDLPERRPGLPELLAGNAAQAQDPADDRIPCPALIQLLGARTVEPGGTG